MKNDSPSISCAGSWTHRPDACRWNASATRVPREIRRFLDGADTRRCSRYDLLYTQMQGADDSVIRDDGEDG